MSVNWFLLAMKILYIHQHFSTLADGGSSRSYYLAKALVNAGIQVELITCHNLSFYEFKDEEGIRVHYLPVYYENALGFVGRGWAFLKFVALAYRLARRIPGASLCYAVSTPLTTGIIALLLKKNKGIRYYFEVGDLWPLAPVQMGVIRNLLLKRLLFALEKKIYQGADKIVALSPGIRDGIEAVAPGKEICLIPNMADCDFFYLEEKSPQLIEKFSVPETFVITYFGTIGKANRLEYLLEAARECQQATHSIIFLIVGKGAELPKLQLLAKQYQLNNVRFIPHADKYALRDILNVTDAVYISFAPIPVLEKGSPNKFFDALAAGKFCIVNFQGWIKTLVEREKCGLYINPRQPEKFYGQMAPLLKDATLFKSYQQNARRLAEAEFSRTKLTAQFTDIFAAHQGSQQRFNLFWLIPRPLGRFLLLGPGLALGFIPIDSIVLDLHKLVDKVLKLSYLF